MSIYIGNTKISEIFSTYTGINTVKNVLELGVIKDVNTEETRNSNATILKQHICNNPNGDVCFYFPAGEYHFNPIIIDDDSSSYTINLLGETKDNLLNSFYGSSKTVIFTNGIDGFINRTNSTGNNETRFMVSHIYFVQGYLFDFKPSGICLGTTENLGLEYNFNLFDVKFHGYEFGIKSPGYSCSRTDLEHVVFTHCKYGAYFESATHMLKMEHIEINYCKYGIRMAWGGVPCSIKDVHVAVGCYEGMNEYLTENPLMYGIHTKGSLVIDGIYYEQYDGNLDVTNFNLIHYEGYGNGGVAKLIVKNTPIGNMGAGGKGKFFYGRKYVGMGTEGAVSTKNVLEVADYQTSSFFQNGCVDFENCLDYDTDRASIIKNSFDIGNNFGIGYRLNNEDIYKESVVLSRYYRRKFKTALDNLMFIPNPDSSTLIAYYSYNSIPSENIIYDGVTISKSPIFDSASKIGVHYKGRITINGLTSDTTNVILGIVGDGVGEDTSKFLVRELVKLNSDTIGKDIIIDVDEFIPLTEATNIFFGYKCINSIDEKITDSDTSKIVYEIESIIDEVEYSKDVGVSRSRAYFKI